MSVVVACPTCGAKIKAPDKVAGKRVKCPRCGEPLAVPSAPAAARPPKQDAVFREPPGGLATPVGAPAREEPGPAPRSMTVKGWDGVVELLENSVRILRKGWLNTRPPEKEILLSAIAAIDFKTVTFFSRLGYIKFRHQGGAETNSRWANDPMSGSDENAVLFTPKQQPEFEQLKRAIEERMAERVQQQPQPARSTSVADELAKLAELRSKGVITEEEFQEQKRRLLR